MLYAKEKRTFPADGSSYRGLILEDWRLVGTGLEKGVHCIHLITKHRNLKQAKIIIVIMVTMTMTMMKTIMITIMMMTMIIVMLMINANDNNCSYIKCTFPKFMVLHKLRKNI